MLHIHNGDSSASILKESGFPGHHFAFREALVEGPTPRGLSDEEWRDVRSRHLAEAYNVKADDCKKELLEQQHSLAGYASHDEVVLWFEHDLFCQVNLLYLLNWFSERELGPTTLSLICIDEFPGVENFRGLGELDAGQMASLFDTRRRVAGADLELAARAWAAYCSATPSAIETLLGDDTSRLPYLKGAMLLHLARFPSLKNGLGRIENKVLAIIAGGAEKFSALFPRFVEDDPGYGFGDAQIWNCLKRLTTATEPLVAKSGIDETDEALSSSKYFKSSFEITGIGARVLAGEKDFIAAGGIDLWLGGVHLSDKTSLWRWDEQRMSLMVSGF
jgi:uncharacterized protein DUF1835